MYIKLHLMYLRMMNKCLEKIANFSSLFLCTFSEKIMLTTVCGNVNMNRKSTLYSDLTDNGTQNIEKNERRETKVIKVVKKDGTKEDFNVQRLWWRLISQHTVH